MTDKQTPRTTEYQLPSDVKSAYVSISQFISAKTAMAKLRKTLPCVDVGAYSDRFKSMVDWRQRRREVFRTMDALIVVIGSKRTCAAGVVHEIGLAQGFEKPVFLFDVTTGRIEPMGEMRVYGYFPLAAPAAKVKTGPVEAKWHQAI
jgi:hypothetical protein